MRLREEMFVGRVGQAVFLWIKLLRGNEAIKFNKLNYKMLGEIESYCPRTQLLNKLQNIFPTVNISHPGSSNSLIDSLDFMIKSLPKPGTHETCQTISNMKNIVDGQELRIQINMMELEQPEFLSETNMAKKQSIQTRCDHEDEHSAMDMADWNWRASRLEYEESLHHEFGAFLD